MLRRFAPLGAEFDDFVRRFATPLLRTALLLSGDRRDAEDRGVPIQVTDRGRWLTLSTCRL